MKIVLVVAALFCQLVPFTAGAQTRELQLRLPTLSLGPAHNEFRWSVYARLGGVSDLVGNGPNTAAVAVNTVESVIGAELSLDNKFCRTVVVGGQFNATVQRGSRQESAEQWLSGCLVTGTIDKLALPTIRLSHRIRWQVRPALSAPLGLAASNYSQETIGFDFNLMSARDQSGHAELFAVQVRAHYYWQSGLIEPGTAGFDFDFSAFKGQWSRHDLALLPLRVQVLEETSTMDLAPVAYGIELSSGLTLFGRAGFGIASFLTASDSLRSEYRFVGELEFTTKFPDANYRAELSIGNSLSPLTGSRALEELRSTVALDWARGKWAARMESFVARSIVHQAEGASDPVTTAGSRASAGVELGRSLRFDIEAETARSFYATLDGRNPEPQLVTRLMAMVSAEFGSK